MLKNLSSAAVMIGAFRVKVKTQVLQWEQTSHLLHINSMLWELWSPAGKGLTSWLLFVMFNCVFMTFPCGILGQVWYLIVFDS